MLMRCKRNTKHYWNGLNKLVYRIISSYLDAFLRADKSLLTLSISEFTFLIVAMASCIPCAKLLIRVSIFSLSADRSLIPAGSEMPTNLPISLLNSR